MNEKYQDDTSSQMESRRRIKANQRREGRNRQAALRFEQEMFNASSRHLILFLTLKYKEGWNGHITLDELRRDRDRLLGNVRFNELLNGIHGYVWKIEEGHDGGGLHLHIVIFYDGQSRADVHFAKEIGDYWVRMVTDGRGDYWNSNANKDHFEFAWGDATGQVDRNNIVKRTSLQNFMGSYMSKTTQDVTSRQNPHIQMFGTSDALKLK